MYVKKRKHHISLIRSTLFWNWRNQKDVILISTKEVGNDVVSINIKEVTPLWQRRTYFCMSTSNIQGALCYVSFLSIYRISWFLAGLCQTDPDMALLKFTETFCQILREVIGQGRWNYNSYPLLGCLTKYFKSVE